MQNNFFFFTAGCILLQNLRVLSIMICQRRQRFLESPSQNFPQVWVTGGFAAVSIGFGGGFAASAVRNGASAVVPILTKSAKKCTMFYGAQNRKVGGATFYQRVLKTKYFLPKLWTGTRVPHLE